MIEHFDEPYLDEPIDTSPDGAMQCQVCRQWVKTLVGGRGVPAMCFTAGSKLNPDCWQVNDELDLIARHWDRHQREQR